MIRSWKGRASWFNESQCFCFPSLLNAIRFQSQTLKVIKNKSWRISVLPVNGEWRWRKHLWTFTLKIAESANRDDRHHGWRNVIGWISDAGKDTQIIWFARKKRVDTCKLRHSIYKWRLVKIKRTWQDLIVWKISSHLRGSSGSVMIYEMLSKIASWRRLRDLIG